ncbi:hypothetical protein FRC08_011880 [Ceratobasidium sp. 394]|nr:hypothetical protein FRC08_011880 [Ceratobasidium sp. 394]
MLLIADEAGWGVFLSDICNKARRARSAEITVEVESQSVLAAKKASKQMGGRKRARMDDIAPLPDGLEMNEEEKKTSYVWYRAIHSETKCVDCSKKTRGTRRQGETIYCHIDKDNNHVELTNEVIGKWVNKCMQNEGVDQFYPPPEIFVKDDPMMCDSIDLEDNGDSMSESELHGDSPELPDGNELIDYINEKAAESALVVYPRVATSLEALNAVKPDHDFPSYEGTLKSVGYCYVDEIANLTPDQLVKDTGMFGPVAREIYKHSVVVSERVRKETVRLSKDKD